MVQITGPAHQNARNTKVNRQMFIEKAKIHTMNEPNFDWKWALCIAFGFVSTGSLDSSQRVTYI